MAFAFNSALHESTKTTLDLLFLGRKIKTPVETRWDLSLIDGNAKSVANQSFWAQAYQNLKSARKRVAQRFNKALAPTNLEWEIPSCTENTS